MSSKKRQSQAHLNSDGVHSSLSQQASSWREIKPQSRGSEALILGELMSSLKPVREVYMEIKEQR